MKLYRRRIGSAHAIRIHNNKPFASNGKKRLLCLREPFCRNVKNSNKTQPV